MFEFEKSNFETEFMDCLEKKESDDIIISTTASLLLQYKFANVITGVKDELWLYEDGIWKLKGKEVVRRQAEILMGDKAKINRVKEVEEKIKRITMISKEEFENIPEGFVCLNNGVLDLLNNELLSHSPKYYFKTKLNLIYDPSKECINCLNFFEDALNSEDIPLIQEWLGFQLYNNYSFKKALIIFGEKDTGKTIFLNLLTKFVGACNCSGVPLQTINSNNRFILSSLQHKYSNIYDDLSSKDLDDVGGFKIATGGGWLNAEKKFGDAFQFKSFAKLTFACNKTPTPKEMDDVEKSAYYGRWLIIPFENQVSEENQDKDLEKKITSSDELSGLLNWAVKGLQRLFLNNKFSFSKSWEDIEKIMISHNNHLSTFSDECLKAMPFQRVSKSDLHDYYVYWCGKRNQAPLSIKQFGKRIVRFAPLIVAKNDGERFWENYNLITDRGYEEYKRLK